MDSLRGHARIVAGRVVAVCADCEGTHASRRASTATETTCAVCDVAFPIAEAIPIVRDGRVIQQCADCAAGRTPIVAPEPEPPAPAPPPFAWGRAQRVGLAAVLLAFVAAPAFVDGVTHVGIDLDVASASERVHRVALDARDHELVFSKYMESDTRPVRWHHPLAGDRRLPSHTTRRFGAVRHRAETRPECGGGHCGVDLGHLRGEVVHAAANGIVDKIVRNDDDLSGRYVRIRHSSGYATFYMHLDRVHPKVEVGDEVSAGDAIGTIGVSGIEHSDPHLHFAIRKTEDGVERFVDPEPLLRKARVRPSQAPFPGPDQG